MKTTIARIGSWVPGEAFYRAFLSGYGSLFFAPSPAAGALFLLGTFAVSPLGGSAALLGLLVATATAHLLKRDRAEIAAGLYGFNGALAAFALLCLSGLGDLVFVLLIPAAAAATWIMVRLLDGRWTSRLNLPALSLPSLLVSWPLLAYLVHQHHGATIPETMMPSYLVASDLLRPEFHASDLRLVAGTMTASWPAKLLFLGGFLVHSRRLVLLVVGGAFLGVVVGWVFLGWPGALNPTFVLLTAAPVFVALAGLFTGAGWRSWLFGGFGVVASFFTWFYLGFALTQLELPILTGPFAITATVFLLVLRAVPPGAVSVLPHAIPLHRVGLPEDAARWAKDRDDGWRYWRQVAELKDRPWFDFTRAADMQRARDLVRRSHRIVALTGAGISTESGIPDYRSGAVAWKQYDTSHFTWDRFLASEESRRKYWEMSQDFYVILRTAEPNRGHLALAGLDQQGKILAIVTQNVDRLHQRAGTDPGRVIELHGTEHRVDCLWCGRTWPRDEVYRWVLNGVAAPYCPSCQGIIKPASTAFGQPMLQEESRRALEVVRRADLLLVTGTSLQVQPAATLPLAALREGVPLLIVNLQPTDYDPLAAVVLRGPCGSLLPEVASLAART